MNVPLGFWNLGTFIYIHMQKLATVTRFSIGLWTFSPQPQDYQGYAQSRALSFTTFNNGYDFISMYKIDKNA